MPNAADLACHRTSGAGPAVVFLPGYASDMSGTKAVALETWAKATGRAFVRFDYRGCGESPGAFETFTLADWYDDVLAMLDTIAGPAVLVGSSMGGWLMLLVARDHPERVAGLVGIAPAPDFTIDLIEPSLGETERRSLIEKGYFEEHSEYSPEPNIFTAKLMDDGRANKVLTGIIETGCPVHILQGMQDRDVPWRHAMKLVEHLPADDVVISLVKDGDHRLSRPEDLALMRRALEALLPGDHG